MNKWIDGWMDESINDQIYKLINNSEFCLKYCNTDDCISLKYHYKSAFQWHIFKLLTNQMSNIYIQYTYCLLYTSDAADVMQCVDLGGRRIIKRVFQLLLC